MADARSKERFERSDAYQRYLEILVEAGELLSESIDYQQTVQNVCNAAVRGIADICVLDLVTEDGPQLAAVAHREGRQQSALSMAAASVPRPSLKVIETGQPLLIPKIDESTIGSFGLGAEHGRRMLLSLIHI